MQNEPNLESIEDYNNQESPQKRSTVLKVIYFLIGVSILLAGLKLGFNSVDDYVGTPENPGINTTKD